MYTNLLAIVLFLYIPDDRYACNLFLIRYTGAPDGYKFDTLNFYHQINFSGREEYTYNDKDNMVFPDNVNSMVLTGKNTDQCFFTWKIV